DLILGASQSFVTKIVERVKDPSIVKYWPQYSVVDAQQSTRLEGFDPSLFHLIFTGNMGEAQGLEEVVKAMTLVENPNIRLHFLGEGRSKASLVALAHEQGVSERIVFHPRVEEALVPHYLRSSDVALLSLKSDPIFDMTIPGKMQTYLACGMPILGCVQGESARIIEHARCGVVSEGNAGAIAKAMEQLAAYSKEEMKLFSENALEYNQMYFNKHKLLEQLEHYLKGEQ
ncbi:MAG: glycosyltransferase family 4 protein, partial [Erysipelotrichaceae bacterium]